MLGKRLTELYEELRKKNILKTKKEFSIFLGVDDRNLSKYLNNEVNFTVSPYNYDKLEEVGINIKWLITGQGEMFKDGEIPKSQKEIERERKEEEEKERLRKEVEELRKKLESEKKIVGELEKDNSILLKEYREIQKQNRELVNKFVLGEDINDNSNLDFNHS